MPGVLPGGDSWWAYQQAQQSNLLRGLLTQQQTTISNLDGLPVINFGLIPGSSPARYGIQFVNPTTGAEIMFIGVDAAGTPGVHIYDASGTEQVLLGELNTSPAIYGLGILPQETGTPGALQMVGGKIFLQLTSPGTVGTAGVYTAFAGTNSVGFNVGPSGIFHLTVGAFLTAATVTAGFVQGTLAYTLDGGTVQPVLEAQYTAANQAASNTIDIDVSTTPGSHTIVMYYASNGGTMNFGGSPIVIVEPL